MHTTALSLLLCCVGLLTSDELPERRGLETGEAGSRAPEARARLLGPEPAHQDVTGSCDQLLLALDGAPDGGFGAIWMDTRQGNLGLYLGLVKADGTVKGPEVPVYPSAGTARQLQPDLAFTSGLTGMLCWRSGVAPKKPIQVRRFRSAPGFRSNPLGFGAPPDADALDPRAPLDRGDRGGRSRRGATPRVAALGDGASLVAWTQGGAVLAQRFDEDGQSVGSLLELDPKGPAPTGELRVASDRAGKALVVWSTADGLRAWIGEPGGRAVRSDVGDGRLLDIENDPRGGWWLLVQPSAGSASLRHLSTRGAVQGGDRGLPGSMFDRATDEGDWTDLDLCAWKHGLAVAATSREPERPVRVYFLSAAGVRHAGVWQPLAESGAQNARVTAEGSQGGRLLVAWTDARHGDRDIFYSLMEPVDGDRLPRPDTPRRWNTDQGSAGQSQPALASAGSRAWITWVDARSGTPRLWMRGIAVEAETGDLGWAWDERPVPVVDEELGEELGARGEDDPALAFRLGGRGLVAWRRVGEDSLRARALDAQGAARGPLQELGTAQRGARLAVSESGFVLLARTLEGNLCVQALDARGSALGPRIVVSGESAADIQNAGLVQLDDDRWLVSWDESSDRGRALAARFLSATLEPQGEVLEFDYSGRGGDLQPAVAPAPQGGFLLAWTAFESRARDVAARVFDRDGEPVDRPLAVGPSYSEQDTASVLQLQNGDWIVVWEDDISRWDQIHARRISAGGKQMGPAVTLNDMELAFTMGRTGPVAAPLGAGFIAAWVDRSRGLGPDVFVAVLDSAFDDL